MPGIFDIIAKGTFDPKKYVNKPDPNNPGKFLDENNNTVDEPYQTPGFFQRAFNADQAQRLIGTNEAWRLQSPEAAKKYSVAIEEAGRNFQNLPKPMQDFYTNPAQMYATHGSSPTDWEGINRETQAQKFSELQGPSQAAQTALAREQAGQQVASNVGREAIAAGKIGLPEQRSFTDLAQMKYGQELAGREQAFLPTEYAVKGAEASNRLWGAQNLTPLLMQNEFQTQQTEVPLTRQLNISNLIGDISRNPEVQRFKNIDLGNQINFASNNVPVQQAAQYMQDQGLISRLPDINAEAANRAKIGAAMSGVDTGRINDLMATRGRDITAQAAASQYGGVSPLAALTGGTHMVIGDNGSWSLQRNPNIRSMPNMMQAQLESMPVSGPVVTGPNGQPLSIQPNKMIYSPDNFQRAINQTPVSAAKKSAAPIAAAQEEVLTGIPEIDNVLKEQRQKAQTIKKSDSPYTPELMAKHYKWKLGQLENELKNLKRVAELRGTATTLKDTEALRDKYLQVQSQIEEYKKLLK